MSSKAFFHYSLLAIIVISGIYLRTLGVRHGLSVHPDERHIMMVVTDLDWKNPNPKSFAYGSLPFYTLKILGDIKSYLANYLPGCEKGCETTSWLFFLKRMNGYDSNFILGRLFSVLIAGLTALVVYILGLKLFKDRSISLFAVFLLMFNPFHLQLSHFFTVDTLLTFLIALSFIPLINIYEKRRFRDYAFAGICIGLALGTKISATILVPLLFLAHFFAYPTFWKAWRLKPLFYLLFATLLIPITTLAVMPYAYLDFPKFWHDIQEQISMAKGLWIPPYTVQYVGTVPLLYHLEQMLHFTLGWPVFLVCFLGLFVILTADRDRRRLFTALWSLAVFILIGRYAVKFPRYLLPIYPFLFLFGGFFLQKIYQVARSKFDPLISCLIPVCVCIYSIIYSFAFAGLYKAPHSYESSSLWIHKNIPVGSRLAEPHWDDRLPLTLPGGLESSKYPVNEVPFYEPDNQITSINKAIALANCDYLIFPTQRIVGSIPRYAEKYPFTVKLLSELYKGNLGFELIYTQKPVPTFGPFSFNDDLADESFSVYDHPKVAVFKNVKKLTSDDIYKIVDKSFRGGAMLKLDDLRTFELGNLNKTRPASEILFAVVIWFIALELLSLIVLPIISQALPSFPELGLGLSKTAGFFFFGWLIFEGAYFGLWNPNRQTVLAVFFLLLGAAIYSLKRGGYFFRFRFQTERKNLESMELFWIISFAICLLLRALSPEIFWGEKPMDSTFLHYLNRLDSFPPDDPWAQGHKLKYYYLGTYILAVIHKLTGIAPGIGFNLGMATIGATLVTALYSLFYGITKKNMASMFYAIAVTICANAELLLLTIKKIRLGEYRGINFDLFWASTRLFNPPGFTEYPQWSILFSDLHAHVIALPMTVVVIALASKLLTYDYESKFEKYAHRMTLGVALGMLVGINSWDGITYSLLLAFVCIFQIYVALRNNLSFEEIIDLIHGWVMIGFCAFLASFPILHSLLGNTRVGTGFVTKEEFTTLWQHLRMFGIWLIPLLSIYVISLKGKLNLKITIGAVIVFLVGISITAYSFANLLRMMPAWQISKTHTIAEAFEVTDISWGIIIFYSLTAAISYASIFSLKSIFPGVLSLFASLALIYTELFFLESRMNTLFKFLQPIWIILGISTFLAYENLPRSTSKISRYSLQAVLTVFMGIGLIGSAINFYIMTTFNRINMPRPTLDGQYYLSKFSPEDNAVIGWLNHNVTGTPTIVEAWGPSYREFGRITMQTGLPVILGWDYHVMQRGVDHIQIEERKNAVKNIYNSVDINQIKQSLKDFQVKYIIVGKTERDNYNADGLAKFDTMPEMFPVAFKAGNSVIYAFAG